MSELIRKLRRVWEMRARSNSIRLAAICVMVAGFCASARAGSTVTGPGIIPIGSSITFHFENAPDTYDVTSTFGPTKVVTDNGAVKIWQQQVATSSTGEWDIFYMQTVNGGPLANNISANWSITMDYDLSQAVDFDQVASQWSVNGTPVSPITNGIGSICCAAATNPILPGWAYYNSGFSSPFPAGVFTGWREIFVDPYSFVTSGGIDPSTANGFTFALHFTLQPPMPVVGGVVSASAFGEFPTFAPGSWIEIYGTALASEKRGWMQSDFNGSNGPTSLSGTSVTIGGQSAFVDYISPLQVNVQVPGTVGTGTQQLVVTTAVGSSAPFPVTVDSTMPGLLAPSNFKINGSQYVVAQFADGTYVLPTGAIAGLTSRPAKAGDTIVIYGIGFGLVNPDSQPGVLVSGLNTLTDTFAMSFGGVPAENIAYDGLASNYMGLYQFNVVVPDVPAGNTVPLTFTLGGTAGTQTLVVPIGN